MREAAGAARSKAGRGGLEERHLLLPGTVPEQPPAPAEGEGELAHAAGDLKAAAR